MIRNATSGACTGGCNATPIADGFSGVAHVGITSDGINSVFFSVAGDPQIQGSSQVWRYTASTGNFALVSQGGADHQGANATNFSFVAAKTNLLALDSGGNLWIGDDTSNAATVGAGRLWTISSLSLSTIPGGSTVGGTNTQAILNVLRGPWLFSLGNALFTPTFNANGTFTATIASPTGTPIGTDAGTWVLTPPNVVSVFTNPQGHLTFTDNAGVVLLSADVLLINFDELGALTQATGSLNPVVEWVALKTTL